MLKLPQSCHASALLRWPLCPFHTHSSRTPTGVRPCPDYCTIPHPQSCQASGAQCCSAAALLTGIGRIKARDNPALYGTDREYTLRAPDDPFYKRFSAEASR